MITPDHDHDHPVASNCMITLSIPNLQPRHEVKTIHRHPSLESCALAELPDDVQVYKKYIIIIIINDSVIQQSRVSFIFLVSYKQMNWPDYEESRNHLKIEFNPQSTLNNSWYADRIYKFHRLWDWKR